MHFKQILINCTVQTNLCYIVALIQEVKHVIVHNVTCIVIQRGSFSFLLFQQSAVCLHWRYHEEERELKGHRKRRTYILLHGILDSVYTFTNLAIAERDRFVLPYS